MKKKKIDMRKEMRASLTLSGEKNIMQLESTKGLYAVSLAQRKYASRSLLWKR